MKNNAAITDELLRFDHIKRRLQEAHCPNEQCLSYGHSIVSSPQLYYQHGRTNSGEKRFRCRQCGKTLTTGASKRRQRRPELNQQVLKLLVNKVPMRRICEVLDIHPATLYSKISYLAEVTTHFVSDRETRLLDSQIAPSRAYISVDRQDYVFNWGTQLDRRNIKLGAVGAVENKSGYVLAMRLNFDSGLNAEDVEANAIARGDYDLPPVFRHYARVWLRREYDTQDTVLSVADSERVEQSDADLKAPHSGMQVHLEYTQYALFLYLKSLLQGVERLRFFIDRDPGLDGACLSAFMEDIKRRRVDVFIVNSRKEMSMQKKKQLIALANREMYKFIAQTQDTDASDIKHAFVRQRLAEYLQGKTKEKVWFSYPLSDMSEVEKKILHLTDFGDYDLEHLTNLYRRATLRGIDKFFMQVRRRISIFERPIATANNHNRKWHGYAAYSPLVAERMLRIFQNYYNYCLPGEDGKTPAMRLGLADQSIPLETISTPSPVKGEDSV